MTEKKLTWFDYLVNKHMMPEWIIMFEIELPPVGNDKVDRTHRYAHRYREKTRRADAIAFNLWGSKGFERIGYEQKSSRADFVKELDDPSKRMWLEQNCHRTYFLTENADVAKKEEIPDGWGLITRTKKGDKFRRVKLAKPRTPQLELPYKFMLSMFRKIVDDHVMKKLEKFEFEGNMITREQLIKIAEKENASMLEYASETQSEARILKRKYEHALNDVGATLKRLQKLSNTYRFWTGDKDHKHAHELKAKDVDELVQKAVQLKLVDMFTNISKLHDATQDIITQIGTFQLEGDWINEKS
ncbi:MAG: hypothetical protein DRQ49_19610 [Gammaproteobacteria bacterium]|nr:MAG: hypothetical protein DRQ49_19610 [Gammaproteobacteria bacterium]